MTTGRINQVTIVAPEAFQHSPAAAGRASQRAPRRDVIGRGLPPPQAAAPGRGQGAPRRAILLPPLSSQSDVRRCVGRGRPRTRRRSPRRPQPRGAALQRSLEVRGLLLLLQRSGRGQAPTEAHHVAAGGRSPQRPVASQFGMSLKSPAAPGG